MVNYDKIDNGKGIKSLKGLPVEENQVELRKTQRKPGYGPGWGELEFLSDQGVLNFNPLMIKSPTMVVERINVTTDTEVPMFIVDDDDSTVPVDEIGTTYSLGSIRYAYMKSLNPPVAYSNKVDVIDMARRRGIGSLLKKKSEEELSKKGVEKIYSLATTKGGLELNKYVGFKVETEMTKDYFDSNFVFGNKDIEERPNLRWVSKELKYSKINRGI